MSAHNLPSALHDARAEIVDPGASGVIVVGKGNAICNLVSATTETRTLSRPTAAGVFFTLHHRTAAGDITVTVTGGLNEDGDTTFVLSDAGQFITLLSIETSTPETYIWRKVSDHVTANLVGTGGLITVPAGLTLTTGDLTFTAAGDIIIPAATAAALEITNGTTALAGFDTRATVKNVSNTTFTGVAPTIASEAAAHVNATVGATSTSSSGMYSLCPS